MTATDAGRAFAQHFEALRASRETREPAWLGRRRAEAFDAFAAQGIPTTKREDWRFTSLAKVSAIAYETAASRDATLAALPKSRIATGTAHRLVFVNGAFSAELSEVGALPTGCRVAALSAVLASDPEAVRRALRSDADRK